MKLDIKIYGDPVLREPAVPVETVTKELRALAQDMIETMHASNGVGLAAQQVGRTEAVFVLDVPESYDLDPEGKRINPEVKMPMVFFNPVIVKASEEMDACEEGCLSFPEISVSVRRPVDITVHYMDMKGTLKKLHLKQFVARAVQHEMDHLKAVLLVDHMSSIKRIALAGQLKRMKKRAQGEREESL